jgi:hypothetical protein
VTFSNYTLMTCITGAQPASYTAPTSLRYSQYPGMRGLEWQWYNGTVVGTGTHAMRRAALLCSHTSSVFNYEQVNQSDEYESARRCCSPIVRSCNPEVDGEGAKVASL